MSTSTLPPGYEPVEAPGVRGFVLSQARAWCVEALAGHGTLEAWGTQQALEDLPGGRGPVRVVAAPMPGPDERHEWAVRHYRRGGWAAHVLADRYLASGFPRPYREVAASAVARAAGIPTPAVVAGAVYPDGRFYRADLVTEVVPDAQDLVTSVFDGGLAPEAMTAAGHITAHLAEAGLRHADLNAANILLQGGASPVRAWVLDLDRCAVGVRTGPAVAAMQNRLFRSLAKAAAARGTEVEPAWLEAFALGLQARLPGLVS